MAFPEVGLACEMLLPMHDYSQIMNHFMQSYPLRRTHFGQCRSSSNLRLEKKNDHACSLVHYLPCSSRLWVHFDSSTTDSSANCNVQSRSSHTLAFLQGYLSTRWRRCSCVHLVGLLQLTTHQKRLEASNFLYNTECWLRASLASQTHFRKKSCGSGSGLRD